MGSGFLMKTYMKLKDFVRRLNQLDESAILCVRPPWTSDAECMVIAPDKNLGVPDEVKRAGFAYFLEVHVAREVLLVLDQKGAALEDEVELLLHYAEYDAYPEWVYEQSTGRKYR